MRKIRNFIFYVAVIGFFSCCMYLIIHYGGRLEQGKILLSTSSSNKISHWSTFYHTFFQNLKDPLTILILQIVIIIITVRIMSWICKKIGQPTVVGEILAGILLGPSFAGHYFPGFTTFVFPAASLNNIQFLSQIGLILFMFIVGMELDLQVLKKRTRDAIVVSHASIVIPFTLGMALAYFIYQQYAPQHIPFLSFALFIGISMSITAFPVLARIVQEKELAKTRLGAMVITCAAADDITAWCILAIVIAVVKAGSMVSALYTIGMALTYVIIMITVVRPFLKKMGDIHSNRENLSKPVVAVFLLALLLSAYVTQAIGIHALFGAFMAGVMMPTNVNFRNIFIEKLEDVSLVLLLPLFFVFTGLRTQIGLLNDISLWEICGWITLTAVVGKFLGSALAAKFTGQSWYNSLVIGSLMNTRGLMELIALNIGYDLGVLTPQIFAMLVIMALVTTFMTGPAMSLINRSRAAKKLTKIPAEIDEQRRYRILISFASPDTSRLLLRLAYSFIKKSPQQSSLTALHLSPVNEINQYNVTEYERHSFMPLRTESQALGVGVKTLFKPTADISRAIPEIANNGQYDWMLIGAGQSIYEGSLLGKILGITTRIINPERLIDSITGREKFFENIFDERVRQIIRHTQIPLGIFINKQFSDAKKIFVPVFSNHDYFLLEYAQKLIHHNASAVLMMDIGGMIQANMVMKEKIRLIEQSAPGHFYFQLSHHIEKEMMMQYDLMLISLDSWKQLVATHSVWLSYAPSVLIIKP